MRFIKSLTILLAIGFASSSFGVAAVGGFYFGGLATVMRSDSLFTISNVNAPILPGYQLHMSDEDATFAIFEGYSTVEDRFFFAGELRQYFDRTSVTQSTSAIAAQDMAVNIAMTNTSTQREFTSFSAMPGIFITEKIVIFARLGMSYVQSILKSNYHSSVAPSPGDTILNINTEKSSTAFRFKGGFGFIYYMKPNWQARVEYVYQDFPSVTVTNFPLTTPPDSTRIGGVHTQQIQFALAYHFGSYNEEEYA